MYSPEDFVDVSSTVSFNGLEESNDDQSISLLFATY